MTANASVSDAAVFVSPAFTHNETANAAVPQAINTHARMNSTSRFEKYRSKINMPDAAECLIQQRCHAVELNAAQFQLPDSPVASISTSKSSRQTSACKYTMGADGRSDPERASSMARRSDGCRTWTLSLSRSREYWADATTRFASFSSAMMLAMVSRVCA